MKFILKYSPEMTIKSRPVRVRFVRQLRKNLKTLLKRISHDIYVEYNWDYMEVVSPDSIAPELVQEVLLNTPGICTISRVLEFSFDDLDSIYQHTLPVYRERLKGKTFAVRCKRTGKHAFNSMEIERYVGGGLNQNTEARGVSLSKPEVNVMLEVRDDILFVVDEIFVGLGGFPIGSQDSVLSLISGGFDSAVASYMTMRRGLMTHFLFFNLGGHEHEIAVKEVALFLWLKYGSSHRVRFITVPFEEVVGEILESVENSQMGVILKRMMLRAGSAVAEELEIDALVTGESVAQVSSQTLRNLSVIDKVTDTLVLRPLIMSDTQIVDCARAIGTDPFSAAIPEYCGVISVKPTTRARMERIEREEARFNFEILEKAIANRVATNIDDMSLESADTIEPDSFETVPAGAVVLDIRHPDEVEQSPLMLDGEVVQLPFYQLNSRFGELNDESTYLLYCDKGMMSRLHASYLLDQGRKNVGVYRPVKR